MTGAQAIARMIEITKAIERCRRLNIVGMAEDYELEREQIRKDFLRCVSINIPTADTEIV